MRILVVTQYFWPENFRINDLVMGLMEKGHEVLILTGKPNYPEGKFFKGYGFFSPLRELYHGAKVFRVPLISRGPGHRARLILNYLSFAFFASLFAPFFFWKKIDAILVFEVSPVTVGFPAVAAKWVTRAPMLFYVLDPWPEALETVGVNQSSLIAKVIGKVVEFFYHQSSLILVQSMAFFTPIQQRGINHQKIKYFPSSAESLYHPLVLDSKAPERSLIPRGFIIMFAGNIGAAQDFPTILAAAERLKHVKDIHWVILGDGRMYRWVQDEVKKRQLSNQVHLLGRYPNESMPRFFSLADVLIVSLIGSPVLGMTIPAKIQAYLACGKPIIAAIQGEGANVIQEARAGLSTPAGDAIGLSETIIKLYQMPPEERKQMGLNGLEYSRKHFDRSSLLALLDEWLRSVKTSK